MSEIAMVANMPGDDAAERQPFFRRYKPFRTAIGLSVLGILAIAGGVVGIVSGRFLAVIAVLAGLGLSYIALYNCQIGRAIKFTNGIASTNQAIFYCVGVVAPAWIWRGNAVLVAGVDRDLAAISVPLIGTPALRWRTPLSRVRSLEATSDRLATLRLVTDEESVSLRMSGAEASAARPALEAARSAASG
jgi:hypothetical protein